MARKRAHWQDKNETPQGGWSDISDEWDDPTFDEVCDTLDSERGERPVSGVLSSPSLLILTEKQRFVIECVFGIGRPESTEEEISSYMGISRQAVHQIKERALDRLRHR